MTDRGTFALSIAAALVVLAGANFQPQFFHIDAIQSSMFIAIAALAYFGENRARAALGLLCPPLWFAVEILVGVWRYDFGIVFNYLRGTSNLPLDKPLNVLAWIAAAILCARSLRAWRKQTPKHSFDKTFWICLAFSLVWAAVMTLWYLNLLPE